MSKKCWKSKKAIAKRKDNRKSNKDFSDEEKAYLEKSIFTIVCFHIVVIGNRREHGGGISSGNSAAGGTTHYRKPCRYAGRNRQSAGKCFAAQFVKGNASASV